ncbi:hypothetical protein VTN49DRAFT_4841 [Thermomyces lanuginosus]|uniref:uncharacterized protein n=1 Tax=Thermomyces lanuginosus TaxID=5541 RepID=UPI00374244D6
MMCSSWYIIQGIEPSCSWIYIEHKGFDQILRVLNRLPRTAQFRVEQRLSAVSFDIGVSPVEFRSRNRSSRRLSVYSPLTSFDDDSYPWSRLRLKIYSTDFTPFQLPSLCLLGCLFHSSQGSVPDFHAAPNPTFRGTVETTARQRLLFSKGGDVDSSFIFSGTGTILEGVHSCIRCSPRCQTVCIERVTNSPLRRPSFRLGLKRFFPFSTAGFSIRQLSDF